MKEKETNTSDGCSKCGAPLKEACMCPSDGEAKVIDITQRLGERNAQLPADGEVALPADSDPAVETGTGDEEKGEQDRIIAEMESLSEKLKARIVLARENKESNLVFNLLQDLNGEVIGKKTRIISNRRVFQTDRDDIVILREKCSRILGE